MCGYCESHNSDATREAESHVARVAGLALYELLVEKPSVLEEDEAIGTISGSSNEEFWATVKWYITFCSGPKPHMSSEDNMGWKRLS